jgi:hypothetical protein
MHMLNICILANCAMCVEMEAARAVNRLLQVTANIHGVQ